MMKPISTLYFLYLYLSCVYFTAASEFPRHATFQIISNSVFIPQLPASFIINLTSNTLSNIIECAEKCLQYDMCQTATYYEDLYTCSLYNEKSSSGQISSAGNSASSVLTMINREPTICSPSSQSSWLQSATTVAGDSSGIAGSSLSLLNTPIPMYYDQSKNRIIVGDHGNQRVIQFSLDNLFSDGTILAGGNGGGCNLNQFWTVVGVAVDSYGQLYVADTACYQVVKFPPNSNSLTYGEQVASLNMPEGLFINPLTDDLYVAVYGDSSVVQFTRNSTNGVVVAGINGCGTALNQLCTPNSIYFDYLYTNALYVADSGNNRILKFPPNTTSGTNGIIVAGSNSGGSGMNQLSNPRALIVDMHEILYISDANNRRIQRWLPNATSGDTIAGGSTGTAPNQFGSTEAIAFDENYNLLVVDRGNNRIQLFNISVC